MQRNIIKYRKFTILLLYLMFCFCTTQECKTKEKKLEVEVVNNIELGELVAGTTKYYYEEDNFVKFEITSQKNRRIRITKIRDADNPDFKIETEWKVGAISGLESDFTNGGVYSPTNNKFYLTVRVKSIQTFTTAKIGNNYFSPSIEVEYIDQ